MYSDEFLNDPGHFRMFVPDNKDVKSKLLRVYHDSPLGMHRGRDATYHALASDFYWRGMAKATKRWVARCLECLKHKSLNQQHGLMHPRFYDKPMNVLGIDLVGLSPKSTNGNRYILTAVRPFSHFLIAIPEAEPNDPRPSCTQDMSHPAQSRDVEKRYKPGQFLMYLPKSNNQADEGISLKLTQYLELLGKAPVSEACKHLYSVFQHQDKLSLNSERCAVSQHIVRTSLSKVTHLGELIT